MARQRLPKRVHSNQHALLHAQVLDDAGAMRAQDPRRIDRKRHV